MKMKYPVILYFSCVKIVCAILFMCFSSMSSAQKINSTWVESMGSYQIKLPYEGVHNFTGKEYIDVANAFNIGSCSNTVELWLKIPTGISGKIGIIMGNYNRSPNSNWQIDTYGKVRFWWNGGQLDLRGTRDLRDNVWHHVAFVRDLENERAVVYIDGEIDAATGAVGSNINLGPMRIGADFRGSATPYFHGQMDNFVVRNYAITQKEVQASMNNYSPIKGVVSNLEIKSRDKWIVTVLVKPEVSAGNTSNQDLSKSSNGKNEYPEEYSKNFIASCVAQSGMTSLCECMLDEMKSVYTFDEFVAIEAAVGAGKESEEFDEVLENATAKCLESILPNLVK